VATVLWTPSGEDADDWFENKAKGFAVGLAARGLTSATTQALKSEVGRERPSGSDRLSFPSGHTSATTVNTRLASRNLRVIPMSKRTRRTLDASLLMLNVGTSWARIEAGAHYPSDTLFSMALGNFIGAFINDAFMGVDPDEPAQVTVHAMPQCACISFFDRHERDCSVIASSIGNRCSMGMGVTSSARRKMGLRFCLKSSVKSAIFSGCPANATPLILCNDPVKTCSGVTLERSYP
jgi:hypothetical protein